MNIEPLDPRIAKASLTFLASKVSTSSCVSATKGQPKSGRLPPLRSTMAVTATTCAPCARTIRHFPSGRRAQGGQHAGGSLGITPATK